MRHLLLLVAATIVTTACATTTASPGYRDDASLHQGWPAVDQIVDGERRTVEVVYRQPKDVDESWLVHDFMYAFARMHNFEEGGSTRLAEDDTYDRFIQLGPGTHDRLVVNWRADGDYTLPRGSTEGFYDGTAEVRMILRIDGAVHVFEAVGFGVRGKNKRDARMAALRRAFLNILAPHDVSAVESEGPAAER